MPLIDEDSRAFDGYMAALGSAETDRGGEAPSRQRRSRRGLHEAVLVPLSAMRIADGCWEALVGLAAHGNLASRSDLEVGARALETGIWGCSRNVSINLGSIEDGGFREAIGAEAESLAERASQMRERVLATLAGRSPAPDGA